MSIGKKVIVETYREILISDNEYQKLLDCKTRAERQQVIKEVGDIYFSDEIHDVELQEDFNKLNNKKACDPENIRTAG